MLTYVIPLSENDIFDQSRKVIVQKSDCPYKLCSDEAPNGLRRCPHSEVERDDNPHCNPSVTQ